MKYYVYETGTYIGGWDANPPAGAIEVPFAPADARQVWSFDLEQWQGIPVTAETITERRYQAEITGIELNGLQINTDDRSKLLINGAALEATIDPAYVMQWKTPSGFVELTGAQVISIARAVRAHIQACFDREAELLAALEAGTLTDEMLGQGWPARSPAS